MQQKIIFHERTHPRIRQNRTGSSGNPAMHCQNTLKLAEERAGSHSSKMSKGKEACGQRVLNREMSV